jgi:hypothetical protein
MGTVKSHIHNIFTKLDVTKRYQIQQLYADYNPSPEDDHPIHTLFKEI